jgi:hypothetical protein
VEKESQFCQKDQLNDSTTEQTRDPRTRSVDPWK